MVAATSVKMNTGTEEVGGLEWSGTAGSGLALAVLNSAYLRIFSLQKQMEPQSPGHIDNKQKSIAGGGRITLLMGDPLGCGGNRVEGQRFTFGYCLGCGLLQTMGSPF